MRTSNVRPGARATVAIVAVCAVMALLAGWVFMRRTRTDVAVGVSNAFAAPQWAFPTAPPPNPLPVRDSVVRHSVPGSTRRYTERQAFDHFNISDWFPAAHPKMPTPVQHGRPPEGWACGFCHLADGSGRPENAPLAGLPAEYIRVQVAAFRDSSRRSANPQSSTNSMHRIAGAVTEEDVRIAADYFAALTLKRRNEVREVNEVPHTRIETIFYAIDGEGTEPIAGRLIEVPESVARHELHDPSAKYITFVPMGSLERGRAIVEQGPTGPATSCITCHGPQLLGVGLIPPIAGRSPTYLLRQLINFRSGTRPGPNGAAMQAVVTTLSIDDLVALAAYVGSLAPSP